VKLELKAGHAMTVKVNRKLSDNSGIYWNNLLNWIDFRSEISDHWRLVGSIKTSKAKYLILFNLLGKLS
jgi:hypothetical protein